MSSDLASLKGACRTRPPASDAQKIDEGESLWLAGHAVPAAKGYIGLCTIESQSIMIEESAVLDAVKDGERYLVRVKGGTKALVRFEEVITLHQPCSCPQAAASAPSRGPAAGGRGATVWDPCNFRCHWELRCGESGRYRVCIPVPVCTSDCVLV